jgi:hypothetical protein
MDKLKLLVFLTLLLCRFSLAAQQSSKIYGIIIKGGHVIDPKNNIDELMDVALLDGRIALIAKNINADQAIQVVDAAGMSRLNWLWPTKILLVLKLISLVPIGRLLIGEWRQEILPICRLCLMAAGIIHIHHSRTCLPNT